MLSVKKWSLAVIERVEEDRGEYLLQFMSV